MDLDPIVQAFGCEPETLKLNCNIDSKNPGYLQVLKEASNILHWPHDHVGQFPAWSSPLFDIFPQDAEMQGLLKKVFNEVLFYYGANDLFVLLSNIF